MAATPAIPLSAAGRTAVSSVTFRPASDSAAIAQMKRGDFSRIPRNALHWAWNRGTTDCTLLECHAPACDPLIRQNAVGLYAEGETPDLSTAVETIRTGDDPGPMEEKVFGKEAAG